MERSDDDPFRDIIRCPRLDKILAETYFCRHGCGKALKIFNQSQHEETCPCAVSACPFDGYHFRGVSLYRHLLDEHADAVTRVAYLQTTTLALHKSDPFRVLLLERERERAPDAREGGSVFLLLNGGGNRSTRSLSLVCLGPRPDEIGSNYYEIKVHGSSPAELWLATGRAPCVYELEGFQAKMFLGVPKAVWGTSGSVSVSIRIGPIGRQCPAS